MRTPIKNSPKVLGLDISTKTIGWALFDIKTQELLELTHVSPRPKSKDTEENKMLELILKSEIFKTKLEDYKKLGIVSVIIEEPLLNSNNVYTIQTQLFVVNILSHIFIFIYVSLCTQCKHNGSLSFLAAVR